ncbi:EpsG family protein [Pseudomonas oligotrophica]|uniref:EpsG family protein n=1 Tax=Pseudomonas oligotrophica TaxID=2912055 RepID=UPI001F1BD8CE|nr:EpsG family protein [Pseudomonas oligotrophica]MCF7203583.1 EpsG family protein [Pseudomonas oligotrophica]
MMIYSTAYSYMANARAGRVGFFITLSPVFFSILLALSLQEGVGTDYYAYLSMAAGEKDLGWIENKNEIFFVWLNDLAIGLGEPQLIFFFTAFIQVSFLGLIVYELKKLELTLHWFFLLYFIYLLIFFNSFNGIRQYTAVYMVVYSFFLLFLGKQIKFIAVVLLASCFHSTAIYFLPFAFLRRALGIKVKFPIILTIVLFLLSLSFADLNGVMEYFMSLTGYSSYLNSSYLGRMNFLGIMTKFPKIIMVLFCAYFLEVKCERLAIKYRFLLNLSYISLFVLIVSFSSTLIWRMYQYFDFFTMVPILILLSYAKQKQFLYFAMASFLLIFLLKVSVFAKGEYLYASILFG